jgi:hypothetical protein
VKKAGFSEEQIIAILRGQAGNSVRAVSASHNISAATQHREEWKSPKARRLRASEEETSTSKKYIYNFIIAKRDSYHPRTSFTIFPIGIFVVNHL